MEIMKITEFASYKQGLRAEILNISMSLELQIHARKLGASGKSDQASICIIRT